MIFLGKKYIIGEGHLAIGDNVIVHPVIAVSQSQKPFKAKIISREINWIEGEKKELCTSVKGGYDAVINDYLFTRLEKII